MTYTHCRGCGRALDASLDKVDGLCAGGGSAGDCFTMALNWARERRIPVGSLSPTPVFASSPLWSVAIDEWLEATKTLAPPPQTSP